MSNPESDVFMRLLANWRKFPYITAISILVLILIAFRMEINYNAQLGASNAPIDDSAMLRFSFLGFHVVIKDAIQFLYWMMALLAVLSIISAAEVWTVRRLTRRA
jgi:hypothetical protein